MPLIHVLFVNIKILMNLKKRLNVNFSNICYCLVDNKANIHFVKGKTKSILFDTKLKILIINIKYRVMQIEQHSEVKFLRCLMDEKLSGEAMKHTVIHKINKKLKFLYLENNFLTPKLRRFLCNVLKHPNFDYACSAWYK